MCCRVSLSLGEIGEDPAVVLAGDSVLVLLAIDGHWAGLSSGGALLLVMLSISICLTSSEKSSTATE